MSPQGLRALALVPLLLVLAAGASAKGPEDVAREFLRVGKEQGLSAAGSFYDTDGLARLKSAYMLLLELQDEHGQPQVREQMFGPGTTLAAAGQKSPVEFYRGVMALFTGELDQVGARFDATEVLGSVAEGEDLVHVVARVTVAVGDQQATSVDLLSFERQGDAWVLLMDQELEQFAAQVRAQVEQARAMQMQAPFGP